MYHSTKVVILKWENKKALQQIEWFKYWIIQIKNSENFATFFETNHCLTSKLISEHFKFDYTTASSITDLDTKWENFYSLSERPKIIEIFTPSAENDKILLSYFDFIK